jgi:seryl-tRNA synthetase
MAGRYLNSIQAEENLPLKSVAFSHSFRTEAGRAGAQVRGLYRVHQFSKVEMFVVCTPDQADELHDEIVELEKEMFTELGLNFRVLDMPTEDLGAPAYRKVDIEACMPGRALTLARTTLANDKVAAGANKNILERVDTFITTPAELSTVDDSWGEISSASNCTDYQARRLNIRYKPTVAPEEGSAQTKFCYTLNGTACAVPRMIIAILEQHQNPDGTVTVPQPLRPYLMMQSTIPFEKKMF